MFVGHFDWLFQEVPPAANKRKADPGDPSGDGMDLRRKRVRTLSREEEEKIQKTVDAANLDQVTTNLVPVVSKRSMAF